MSQLPIDLLKHCDNDVWYGTDDDPITDERTGEVLTDQAPTTATWELRGTEEGAAVVSGAIAYQRPGVYLGTITKANTAGLTLNATYYRVITFVSSGRSDTRIEAVKVVYRGKS